MEKITDWIALWKELVEKQGPFWNRKKRSENNEDKWKDRARGFDIRVKKRWSRPDIHRNFIVSKISEIKDATVLDIGAGTGAWAILLSGAAKKVTAIEPSKDMRKILKENLKKENIENVEVLDGLWPVSHSQVEAHDFSLSSHSVYGCDDLPDFINAMTESTRYTCFMLLRAPDHDGLMAKAANHIWGQSNDSPNFQVAYNAMLQMGIFPNVLMEEKGMWPCWTNKNIEEALERIRSRFDIKKDTDHEQYLTTLLSEHLIEDDGIVRWPSEVRTGLVYWNSDKHV